MHLRPHPEIQPSSRRSARAVAGLAATGLLLILVAGCSQQPLAAPGQTVVQGTVTLPKGMSVRLSDLTVRIGAASAKVDGSGRFRVQAPTAGPLVAVAEDASGDPVLLGWIGPHEQTLSVRTTAEVLVYLAGGLFAAPPSESATAVQLLSASTKLSSLTAAISKALTADPGALVKKNAAVTAALAATVKGLKASVSSQGVVVNPANGASGVEVILSGNNDVTPTNYYRRRAHVYVDQVSYTTGTGAARQVHDLKRTGVASEDVPETTGVTSTTDALGDIFQGTAVYSPVGAKAIHLPVYPSQANRSTYRLTLVGPGGSLGAYDKLSTSRKLELRYLEGKTLFLDYIVPFALMSIIPRNKEALAKAVKSKDAELTEANVKDFINAVTSVAPDIWQTAASGNMRGAMDAAWAALASSDRLKLVVEDGVKLIVKGAYGESSAEYKNALAAFEDGGLFKKLDGILSATDMGFKILDGSAEFAQILMSNEADQWTLTVDKSKVRLSPAKSYMLPTDYNHILQVSGLDTSGPNAPVYIYQWSTSGKGGEISDDAGHYGTSFQSSDSFVAYNPRYGFTGKSITDSVTVHVYRKVRNGQPVYVGSAQATVTLVGTEALVVPQKVSVKPGGSHVFRVDLNPPLKTPAPVFVQWSTSGTYGSLDATQAPMPQDEHVTYTAKSGVEGTDTVTADVYVQRNGKLTSMGEATATVLVQKVPTVEFGKLLIEVVAEPNDRQGVYAIVTAPKVKGATRYDLYGYDFYDTGFYGRSLSATAPPFTVPKELKNLQGWSLTAVWGPGGFDPTKIEQEFKNRFKGGVWQITVTR